MKKLKHISIIAVLAYIAMVPLGMILPGEPELRGMTFGGSDNGIQVSGEVVYNRGFVTGVADYSIPTGKREYSSAAAEEAVKSGEVPHSEIEWRIDWAGLPIELVGVWIAVGLVYLFVTQEDPHRLEEQRNSEQVEDGDARSAP